jgi:hypothetical protein
MQSAIVIVGRKPAFVIEKTAPIAAIAIVPAPPEAWRKRVGSEARSRMARLLLTSMRSVLRIGGAS